MTLDGARLWMYHMNNALNEMNYTQDKRVRKCIDVFLNHFMIKYSIEFDFNFFNLLKSKL